MCTMISSVTLTSPNKGHWCRRGSKQDAMQDIETKKRGKGDTDPKPDPTLPYYHRNQVTLAAAPFPYRASANGAEPSAPSFPPLH